MMVVLLGLAWYTAISETTSAPVKAKEHLEKAAELEAKEIYIDAAAEYESALEYEPDNEEIYLKLAKADLNSGDITGFEIVCKDTAQRYQNSSKALDMLMNYYVENHYEDQAIQYLKSFIETYPENEKAREWFTELEGSYTELYCRYDEMGEIVNNSMVVAVDGKYGLADAEGSAVIPCEYKKIYPFCQEGFALAQRTDGTWVYIDENQQVRKAPDKEYGNLGMYTEQGTVAEKNDRYGYLDEEMEPVGKFRWEDLTGIRNGVGAGKLDGKWTLIDAKGKAKSENQYDDIVIDDNGFCSSQERIFVKTKNSYRMIDTKGKTVGELTFDSAKTFQDSGYAAVCKDEKWGFVNKDGELKIDYNYDDAKSFRNGFAAVCIDGKWGYIDTEGEMAIQPEFLEASAVSEQGTAAVITEEGGNEKWRLLKLNLFQ